MTDIESAISPFLQLGGGRDFATRITVCSKFFIKSSAILNTKHYAVTRRNANAEHTFNDY